VLFIALFSLLKHITSAVPDDRVVFSFLISLIVVILSITCRSCTKSYCVAVEMVPFKPVLVSEKISEKDKDTPGNPRTTGILMRRSRAVKCDRATEVSVRVVIPAPVFQPTTTVLQ
jgi:hypothetical protein